MSRMDAARPAGPPPMTTTSYGMDSRGSMADVPLSVPFDSERMGRLKCGDERRERRNEDESGVMRCMATENARFCSIRSLTALRDMIENMMRNEPWNCAVSNIDCVSEVNDGRRSLVLLFRDPPDAS